MECARRIARLPKGAVEDTKRVLNIQMERAVLAVLDYALAAEDRSFTTPELRANVDRMLKRSSDGSRVEPPAHGDDRTLVRRQRDVAHPGALGAPRRRGELDAPQDLTDHDAHLGQGEGRTEAAPPAAAERDPDVRVGPLPDEALRAELQRLGVEPRVAHHEVDRRVDEGARRQRSARAPSPMVTSLVTLRVMSGTTGRIRRLSVMTASR